MLLVPRQEVSAQDTSASYHSEQSFSNTDVCKHFLQATAGVDDSEDYEDMGGRPGSTIGQPSIMNGLNRQMVHTTSAISNAPNVPVSRLPIAEIILWPLSALLKPRVTIALVHTTSAVYNVPNNIVSSSLSPACVWCPLSASEA